MKPIKFKESNTILKPQPGTEELVGELHTYRGVSTDNHTLCISCWTMSEEEWEEFNRQKKLWLIVMGITHPPITLTPSSPFTYTKDK